MTSKQPVASGYPAQFRQTRSTIRPVERGSPSNRFSRPDVSGLAVDAGLGESAEDYRDPEARDDAYAFTTDQGGHETGLIGRESDRGPLFSGQL